VNLIHDINNFDAKHLSFTLEHTAVQVLFDPQRLHAHFDQIEMWIRENLW